MSLPVAVALLAVLAASVVHLRKREQAVTAQIGGLAERIRELQVRVDAAEADVAHAVTRCDIAESLLVEKGVADEEDIEEVRRRFGDADAGAADSSQERNGGELH
jgi:type II secretory pathway component PulJ